MAEGFSGDDLAREVVRRGTATDEGDARFMIGITNGGGCIRRQPARHRRRRQTQS